MKNVYTITMGKDIYTIAYELKDLFASDSRINDLNEKEKLMKENEEVLALVKKKDLAVMQYEKSLKISTKDNKEEQKALHQSKLELDNHPVVRAYLDAYVKVRDLYFAINDILFAGLKMHMKGHR